METYYDASVTASILLQEVMKEMNIKESPENCCKNGLDKKIFRKCSKIIEREYSNPEYQELLKLYISSYFIDESTKENGVYPELDEDQLFFGDDDFYFNESNNYFNDLNKAV